MGHSLGGTLAAPDTVTKKCEHPAVGRTVLGGFAKRTADKFIADCYRARLNNSISRVNGLGLSPGTPLALPGGVAEMFGYRLAEYVGVNVPRVTLTGDIPDEERCRKHYVKRVSGGYMLSERVARSIPVYFLRAQAETLPGAINEKVFRSTFISLFDKKCPLDREAYADFPGEAPAKALEAARWDSDQRLLQYAYRAFLNCTYPHTSNALVDIDGLLWLIDFEKTYIPEIEDDIGLLHRMVCDSSAAMSVCRRVSGITPKAIEQALSGIPSGFWLGATGVRKNYGVHDSEEGALEYFTDRLQRWQEAFGYEQCAEGATTKVAAASAEA